MLDDINIASLVGETLTHIDVDQVGPHFQIRVNDATVISRWVGESNGCYSERVGIVELAEPPANLRQNR